MTTEPPGGLPTDLPLEMILGTTATAGYPADLVVWDLALLVAPDAVEAAHRDAATELWGRDVVRPLWWAAVSRPLPIGLGLHPDATEARAVLELWGVPPAHVPRLLPRYLPALTRARLRQSGEADRHGARRPVRPVPRSVADPRRWRVLHGTVTGTHPVHLRARAGATGLDSWMHPGIAGTGIDGTTWEAVLRAARLRGQACTGLSFAAERSVVVSRNPRILQAGVDSGFHVVDCGRISRAR